MIDAGINYSYTFPLTSIWQQAMDVALTKQAQNGWNDDGTLDEIQTVMNFLHSEGSAFPSCRVLLDRFSGKVQDHRIQDGLVLLSVFPEMNIGRLVLNLRMEALTVEETIFLRQLQGNEVPITVEDQQITVKELARRYLQEFMGSDQIFSDSYFVEINRFHEYILPADLEREQQRALYGIMTGDEGYRFVPEELAVGRLTNSWSSRDFMRVYAFGNGFVFVNLTKVARYAEYVQSQDGYTQQFYGSKNPYFSLESRIAGVNHGIFNAIETVEVMKLVLDRMLMDAGVKKGFHISKSINDIKKQRRGLILALNRIERVEIAEMGQLERIIMASQDIDPIVEKIRSLMDLLESELDLIYQTRNNVLVTILTCLSIIIAMLQLL